MVQYSLVKMTSQMVLIFPVKKDHPNHTRHVKIDLSKMIGVFLPPSLPPLFGFFLLKFNLKNQEL